VPPDALNDLDFQVNFTAGVPETGSVMLKQHLRFVRSHTTAGCCQTLKNISMDREKRSPGKLGPDLVDRCHHELQNVSNQGVIPRQESRLLLLLQSLKQITVLTFERIFPMKNGRGRIHRCVTSVATPARILAAREGIRRTNLR
jgi:hypothetical protein